MTKATNEGTILLKNVHYNVHSNAYDQHLPTLCSHDVFPMYANQAPQKCMLGFRSVSSPPSQLTNCDIKTC